MIKYLTILLFWWSVPTPNSPVLSDDTEDRRLAEDALSLFKDQLEEYTNGDYYLLTKINIQEQLLTSPGADFASDIPGLEYDQMKAENYLQQLKQSGTRIAYGTIPTPVKCSENPLTYGVTVSKTIHTADGKSFRYEDFIEVRVRRGVEARINSVSSSRYSSYAELSCRQVPARQAARPNSRRQTPSPTPTPADSCPSLAEADQASAAGRTAGALALYRDALRCNYRTDYVCERIRVLSSRETITGLLAEAESSYAAQDYRTAVSRYELLLNDRYTDVLSPAEATNARKQLKLARNALAFQYAVETGDYEFDRQSYSRARTAYQRALALRPASAYVRDRLRRAEGYVNGSYRREALAEIAEAVRKLQRHPRYNGEASVTLMKYADTDWLTGQQLFYLVQLLDAKPGPVKRTYGLSQRDICVRVKLLTRKATARGLNTRAFTTFRRDHLNKRSRTCS